MPSTESPPSRESTSDVSIRTCCLLVDLNNWSAYPTLAIGSIVAALRGASLSVEVLCPLAYDVPAFFRERPETAAFQIKRRIHFATHPSAVAVRNAARRARKWWMTRPHPRVLSETAAALDRQPDIVLLSAYLMHYPSVRAICSLAFERGVPVVLGGPMFNLKETADAWRTIPGLSAIVGGEVDRTLPSIVAATVNGEDLLQFPGVYLPDGTRSPTPPPLKDLSTLPIPDFTDFPWDRYKTRVVPLMASRGCGWSQCVFCSDVIGSSGRTFRARTVGSVLDEMEEQSRRYETNRFIFLDIKMNSDLRTWYGIAQGVQSRIPGVEWIGTVHVDNRRDNGLSRDALHEASSAGLRRLSFGLESGSQRLLDLMDKGTDVERNAEFIRDAAEAGISVRCTMMQGFPGENKTDLDLTSDFLEQHADYIDRIQLNSFSLLAGTRLHGAISQDSPESSGLKILSDDARSARAEYVYPAAGDAGYRRSKHRLLSIVHQINRRPLQHCSPEFDGLM